MEDFTAWLRLSAKKWAAEIKTLGRYARSYTQEAYVGLAMFLQSEWEYIQHAAPGVVTFMGSAETAIWENFFPVLLGMAEVPGRLIKLLDLVSNSDGMGIPEPMTMADECYKVSLGCSKRMVELLMTGDPLYSVDHRYCVWKGIV